MNFLLFGIFLLFSSCTWRSEEYRDFYSHLHQKHVIDQPMHEEDYFLIILVNARHLDYTKGSKFFQSVVKHPIDGSKNGDVGHAWIYLQGKRNDQTVVIEGGHSGERQSPPVPYFDGIMNYNDWGYANPTDQQLLCPRYEPNPIKYLWTVREDGFFQKGSGGHRPTYAAKVSLTAQQFEDIVHFIQPTHYCYRYYALLGSQCCSFVSQVANLAGFSLSYEMTMKVAPYIYYGNTWIRLWEDPHFGILKLSTPDIIEKSLMNAVKNGEAEYALDWYLARQKNHF